MMVVHEGEEPHGVAEGRGHVLDGQLRPLDEGGDSGEVSGRKGREDLGAEVLVVIKCLS